MNHVSIWARDLEESARFYEQLFGMERIPAPRFRHGVVWLRLGQQQLHLLDAGDAPTGNQHFGLDVDDFEGVYRRAHEFGLLDHAAFGDQIREHPAGWVQMYLRDPSGNLVEVDWPDASTLDRSVVRGIARLDEQIPQRGDAAIATLYLSGPGS